MSRRSMTAGVLLGIGCALLAGCGVADEEAESADAAVIVSKDLRREAVKSAQVWSEEEFKQLKSKDLARGPAYEGAPLAGQEIDCTFVEPTGDNKPGGKSPKFLCNDGKVELKVKFSGKGRPYGETNPSTLAAWALEDAKTNGEVFAEVMGTRLLWALGFYADGVYPVKVTCRGCPEKPWEAYQSFPQRYEKILTLDSQQPEECNPAKHSKCKPIGGTRADRRFEFAAVEIKIPGKKIESKEDEGFDWVEDGNMIDPATGAKKEEFDALRLLAAFMYHSDNKAANQRLFCAQGKMADDGKCAAPRAMIQDIGMSFGSEGAILGLGYDKAELDAWKEWPLWKDQTICQARLSPNIGFSNNNLKDPIVSDAGRELLARLMDPNTLTDEMLTTIFTVSRVAERGEKIKGKLVTVADWVKVFNARRAELASSCGPRR